ADVAIQVDIARGEAPRVHAQPPAADRVVPPRPVQRPLRVRLVVRSRVLEAVAVGRVALAGYLAKGGVSDTVQVRPGGVQDVPDGTLVVGAIPGHRPRGRLPRPQRIHAVGADVTRQQRVVAVEVDPGVGVIVAETRHDRAGGRGPAVL